MRRIAGASGAVLFVIAMGAMFVLARPLEVILSSVALMGVGLVLMGASE